MSKNSEAVKRWRKNTKKRLIAGFGGQCGICGYSKCDEIFDFHHLNPSEKEFHWGAFKAHIRKWDELVKEIRKCIMLCSNCHREVHAGVSVIPTNVKRFDERYTNYKSVQDETLMNACPVCATLKPSHYSTCSLQCAGKRNLKIDWAKYDLKSLQQQMTIDKIADLIGCSFSAVQRQRRKLGLIKGV